MATWSRRNKTDLIQGHSEMLSSIITGGLLRTCLEILSQPHFDSSDTVG